MKSLPDGDGAVPPPHKPGTALCRANSVHSGGLLVVACALASTRGDRQISALVIALLDSQGMWPSPHK